MNTTIKTSSEKQFTQIRRFVKKNKIHNIMMYSAYKLNKQGDSIQP